MFGPVGRHGVVVLAVIIGALALMACGRREEPPKFPIIPSDSLVKQGKNIYFQSCATCHGDEKGEGQQLGAPPHTVEGHTWHHPDRLLFQWVLDGPPLRTAMPAFRGQLSEQEVIAVIAFIKTLWPEDIRQRQTEGSRQYEEQIKKYPD